MITKFMDTKDTYKSVEFTKSDVGVSIYITEDEMHPTEKAIGLELSKENLFDLIGQLLRIQSQLKGGI